MFRWGLGFFVVALVVALLEFAGTAVAAAGIAKTLLPVLNTLLGDHGGHALRGA